MNKLVTSLVFMLSVFIANAQPQNQQTEINTLAQKVDSLEHELSYLNLNYELSMLKLSLNTSTNEMYAKTIAIQLDLYNRNFNSNLGDGYKNYYDACVYQKESFDDLLETKKKYFALKIMTYPYTENELKVLKASYLTVGTAYDTFKQTLDLLKISIDMYRELM